LIFNLYQYYETGVDFTKSNEWNGKETNHGRSLHAIVPNEFNPYQRVMSIMASTLEAFDSDKLIPAYGFGMMRSTTLSPLVI
jgi:hypothetical protein